MRKKLAVPADVKLMNMTASVLLMGVAVALLASVVGWGVRQPVFAISGISVLGDVTHNNVVTLRANLGGKLRGNFFTLDLMDVKNAFESVPWVRRAEVRREFPNRLRVVLQEQQAVAFWGADGESKLLNSYGEIFEANVDEAGREDLPHLNGPAEEAGQVLGMYRTLAPMFEVLDATLDSLSLSSRGGWLAKTDAGSEIELGRGTAEDVVRRLQRFLGTVTQVAGQYGRTIDAVERADLRYNEGYALRMNGVTTVTSPLPPPKKK